MSSISSCTGDKLDRRGAERKGILISTGQGAKQGKEKNRRRINIYGVESMTPCRFKSILLISILVHVIIFKGYSFLLSCFREANGIIVSLYRVVATPFVAPKI